ncbi:MAG TPA: ABC transporter ATP-binding protein [Spirochaetaceae bacterium]|nr:ABC transporter ATP-binding protein [Spirochaetaceae bacterium]
MPDFFDNDEIVKSYDAAIVRRIFRYVRPYKALLAVAALALVLTTLGELLLPVIIKDTVDDALVLSFVSLDEAALGQASAFGLDVDGDAPRAAGKAFLRQASLASLTASGKRSLVEAGALDLGPYYLTAWTDESLLPAVVRADLSDTIADGRPALLGSYFIASEAYVKALSPADARVLRARDAALATRNALIFLVILSAVLLGTFAQTWTTSLIGQKVMKDLRMDLFSHTTSQSLAFLSKQPVGRLVTRLTSDVETINEFFTSVVVSFIKDASIMAGVLAVLVIMSPRLALIAILSLPPVLVASSISRRKARDAFRKQRTWLSKVNAFLAEHIAGVAVVKLFGRERASALAFEGHDRELMKANLGEMYVFATFRPLIEFFSATSTAIILWYGASLFGTSLISLGTLIAFVNLIRMFYAPLQDISEKYTILQSAMAGGERVFKLLDADERIPDRPTTRLPAKAEGRLEFDRVWFAYKDEEWILKDISFSVAPGETVAIVGYTGAGKSTIGSLLARLWDVQKGEIRLDGIPIKDLPLEQVRSSIRPVMQDVFLFSGSVAENIDMGLGLSPEALADAAKAVHAHEFIERLPGRYDEKLGEGAATLSSGQRQLLSFARVVAHEPAIVMLDEATSSVDTETERLVQEGLLELMRGRTTIAIAHRLSTIRHADRILVLSEGRLAESGDHDSLVAKRGIYYNLYRLQYENTGSEPA